MARCAKNGLVLEDTPVLAPQQPNLFWGCRRANASVVSVLVI